MQRVTGKQCIKMEEPGQARNLRLRGENVINNEEIWEAYS